MFLKKKSGHLDINEGHCINEMSTTTMTNTYVEKEIILNNVCEEKVSRSTQDHLSQNNENALAEGHHRPRATSSNNIMKTDHNSDTDNYHTMANDDAMIQNKNACNLQHSVGLNDAEQDLSDENNIISSRRETKEECNNDAKTDLAIDIKIVDHNNAVQNCVSEKECKNLQTNNDVSTNGQMCKDEKNISYALDAKANVKDKGYLDKDLGRNGDLTYEIPYSGKEVHHQPLKEDNKSKDTVTADIFRNQYLKNGDEGMRKNEKICNGEISDKEYDTHSIKEELTGLKNELKRQIEQKSQGQTTSNVRNNTCYAHDVSTQNGGSPLFGKERQPQTKLKAPDVAKDINSTTKPTLKKKPKVKISRSKKVTEKTAATEELNNKTKIKETTATLEENAHNNENDTLQSKDVESKTTSDEQPIDVLNVALSNKEDDLDSQNVSSLDMDKTSIASKTQVPLHNDAIKEDEESIKHIPESHTPSINDIDPTATSNDINLLKGSLLSCDSAIEQQDEFLSNSINQFIQTQENPVNPNITPAVKETSQEKSMKAEDGIGKKSDDPIASDDQLNHTESVVNCINDLAGAAPTINDQPIQIKKFILRSKDDTESIILQRPSAFYPRRISAEVLLETNQHQGNGSNCIGGDNVDPNDTISYKTTRSHSIATSEPEKSKNCDKIPLRWQGYPGILLRCNILEKIPSFIFIS